MSVAAHPHAGLQTVSWLFTGEIVHRDSLGSIQKVLPGQLNLMTAGRGIAHSELSINNRIDLHGVQLWTVLPDHARNLEPFFEYGVLVVSGQASVNGHSISPGQLHYVPAGRVELGIASASGAKLILLGGEPFGEKIVMWWNFIGRSHEEILEMREDWENQSPRFEPFHDRIGGRIPAPPLPNLKLKSRANPSAE